MNFGISAKSSDRNIFCLGLRQGAYLKLPRNFDNTKIKKEEQFYKIDYQHQLLDIERIWSMLIIELNWIWLPTTLES